MARVVSSVLHGDITNQDRIFTLGQKKSLVFKKSRFTLLNTPKVPVT